jgi:hypothetical protein
MSRTKEVLLIVLGGSLGGLLSVMDAWANPVSYPLSASKLASLLLIPMLKGGAASGIGVYLLTQLDSTQVIRGFFFAVTCGLTFPAILANGGSLAETTTSQVARKAIAENTSKLRNVAGGGPLSAAAVSQIQDASIAILQAAPKAGPFETRTAAAAVQQAVSELGKSATDADDPHVIEAISSIGTVAATHDDRTSADAALRELEKISGAAGVNDELRASASRGMEQITRSSTGQ